MTSSTTRRSNDRPSAHANRARPADGVPGRIDAGLGRFLYYVSPCADGWELVQIVPGMNPENLVAYFKRPLNSAANG